MNKILLLMMMWYSLTANTTFAFSPPRGDKFTRQDSLRGSNGKGRSWWDVQHYTLHVSFDLKEERIRGWNNIAAKITAPPADSLQLDLQELMFLDSVKMGEKHLNFVKEGNVWWVMYPFSMLKTGDTLQLTAYYHGKPITAKRPPWDGGFIWTKDSTGKPWVAVACQGLGASSWWPCKDYQGDEPDNGMMITYDSDTGLALICNGKTIEHVNPMNRKEVSSTLTNPINTYNATFYIGDYVSWTDTLMGEKGQLDLSFHALRYNEARAREQFAVTKDMLHCFEYWMGPYPFYEDGYKLVEAPYLGMEHQSAVAYGNQYKMGYLGMDPSGTGVGLLFDFIIIHESGHEWFGNNITAQDVADNWLHEGFTTYTEALFAECAFGKEKAYEYTRGQWKGIHNDRPVIGTYGVHNEGSGDKYDKGAAVVHMLRTIMNNDEQFRQLLRGLNKNFYHQVVTTFQIEDYISRFAGYDFRPLFDQYLRTTDIPQFDYYIKKKQLFFRFKHTVDNFTLPITITTDDQTVTVYPTSEWQQIKWTGGYNLSFPKDFLVKY